MIILKLIGLSDNPYPLKKRVSVVRRSLVELTVGRNRLSIGALFYERASAVFNCRRVVLR
jgi:hypothetical protein